jgi:hypothetical protein
MSDYYRDRVRHGGILSNTFISKKYAKHVSGTMLTFSKSMVVESPGGV